jgi:hypothetical protein
VLRSCRDDGARSAISSIIFALNAGMSSGFLLATEPASTTTSSSLHSPPALRISVRIGSTFGASA